jgi:hypothetical protein
MNTYEVIVTDTFGGELNYAWVRRAIIRLPAGISARTLMHRAKKAVGYTGVRLRAGGVDGIFFVVGACIALTVTEVEGHS